MKTKPDGTGAWLVQNKNGSWWPAIVIKDFENNFEAMIVNITRWHPTEWLSMNGWENWKRPED